MRVCMHVVLVVVVVVVVVVIKMLFIKFVKYIDWPGGQKYIGTRASLCTPWVPRSSLLSAHGSRAEIAPAH